MNNIHIAFELLIVVIVVLLQLYFFKTTKRKMSKLSSFFPKEGNNDSYFLTSEYSEATIQLIDIKNHYSDELKGVINSINSYLKKNSGTADFSIIKSIVERSIEAKENAVSANVSLPLYIGLMGTFAGVIIGLLKIAFWGGVTEQNINSFIGGVVIAMVASFFGLLLTVINNSNNFKNASSICDERKNNFYNFLQVELLPHLGNSLYDVLDRLKYNINDFNNKFENNIKLFDNKFSENISSLRISVSSLSENINLIVDNTKTQKDFLIELRRMGYNRMAEANVRVFQLLKDTGPTFIKFIESQKELNQSVEHANQFVSVIENILNRVKSFEENINSLGDRINTNQFLGNEVLKRIDVNLKYLDQQFELLKQHEIKSSDGIQEYFERQYSDIQRLADNIKRELEEALNFSIDKNPLLRLHLLEGIETNMSELNKKINFNGEFKNISDNVITTKNEIQGIKNQLTIAIDDNKNRNNKRTMKETKPKKIDTLLVIPEQKKSFFRRLNLFKR